MKTTIISGALVSACGLTTAVAATLKYVESSLLQNEVTTEGYVDSHESRLVLTSPVL
jgi:hypothetical protein